MAPKKSTKKEVLEQPGALPDGEHNYYVGGWSYYQSIEDISTLAHDLNTRRIATLEAATAEEEAKMRQAGAERVNVLVLPTQLRGGQTGADGGAAELVMVDRMHIEGVPRRALNAAAHNVKSWASDTAAAATVDEATRPGTAAAGTEEGAAGAAPGADKDTAAEVLAAAVAAVATEAARRASGAASDSDEQQRRRRCSSGSNAGVHPPRYGCSSTAAVAGDVQVDGEVCVIGVTPHIFVRPRLPTDTPAATAAAQPASGAATPQRRASRASSASASRGRPSSQRRNKTKLTPEQLVEQERQRAEAEALLQRQTEEAIAAARTEEAHLRTFAHPDRWATVELCNMTFTGAVTVRQAHVTFQNCCFCGADGDVPQLTIAQYCRVTCVACSFEAPVRCAVYALPTSRLQLRRCLFSGVPACELARLKFTLPGAGDRHNKEDDDASGEADGHAGVEHNMAAAGLTSEVLLQAQQAALVAPLTAEQMEACATVAHARPAAVAVQADAAQLRMDDCCCLFLCTAVAFSGRWGEESGGKSANHRTSAVAQQAASFVQKCHFVHLYGSGIVVHKAGSGLVVQQNVFADCTYYAVDCDHTTRDVALRGNSFAADAVLRLREGAKAVALRNVMHSIAVDENKHVNLCLEPVY